MAVICGYLAANLVGTMVLFFLVALPDLSAASAAINMAPFISLISVIFTALPAALLRGFAWFLGIEGPMPAAILGVVAGWLMGFTGLFVPPSGFQTLGALLCTILQLAIAGATAGLAWWYVEDAMANEKGPTA